MVTLNESVMVQNTLGRGKAIMLGLVPGVMGFNKFGSNVSVGTSYETLWPESTFKAYRSTNALMNVSSSSANDASAGTGMQTVTIYGVDEDWEPVKETVTLNGVSDVAMISNMMIVYRMVGETGGSGGTNAGVIYVGTGTNTAGKPAVVECLVSIGEGQSEVSFFPVPAGTRALIDEFSISSATSVKIATVGLFTKPLGGIFNLRAKRALVSSGDDEDIKRPIVVSAKSIIEMRAFVDATTGYVTGDFQFILEGVTDAQRTNLNGG